jgi:hypothetical protein
MLEKGHAMMARTIQGLPPCVANDGVIQTLGWYSIKGTTDRKRSMFLGRILDSAQNSLPKQVILMRLMEFRHENMDRSYSYMRSPVQMMCDSVKRIGLLPQLNVAIDNGG